MKKVLVTGGAGFIGSHTVDLLLKKGYAVRILDSLEPPVHPERKKPSYLPAAAEFIQGDVTNPQDLEKAMQGVEGVFHLAAYQGYLNDFSKFARVNDAGTALIYEVIVAKKLPVKKVVFASSQAVYGEGKYQCPEHGISYPTQRPLAQLEKKDWEINCPVCGKKMTPQKTDESRVNPHNPYGISKYCQELYAINIGKRFGIPTVGMRYSITQGARQSLYNAYNGILRIFTNRLYNGQPLVIYEDGKQIRDFVYVGDVAKANVLVMEDVRADYQVFNVGGVRSTVQEYAEIFQKVVGKKLTIEIPGSFRFSDTRHINSDISKLESLGWQSNTKMERFIEEFMDWASRQPLSNSVAEADQMMRKQGIVRGGT
jgi:dTDP-L-rhamnose 4-epimerase